MSLDLLKRAWFTLLHKGGKAFLSKAVKEFGVSVCSLNQMAMRCRHALWTPSLAKPEKGPEHIRFGLDHPATDCLESDELLNLVGWCQSDYGISQVSFFIDTRFQHTTLPAIPRPGETHPQDGATSVISQGFAESINLAEFSYDTHQLYIVISDHAGHRRLINKTVVRRPSPDAYHRYYWAVTQQDENRLAVLPGEEKRLLFFIEDGDTNLLKRTITSLCDQIYHQWNCVVVPSSVDHSGSTSSFDIIPPSHRDHFSFASEIDLADTDDADFVAFLKAGECLSPIALVQFLGEVASHPAADLLYSDHDQVNLGGFHLLPYHKPNWSPTYLLAHDYIGGLFLMRLALARTIFPHLSQNEPSWRYDLLLRVSAKATQVRHVPKVLWSSPVDVPCDGTALEAELSIATRFLHKMQPLASISATNNSDIRRIFWPMAKDAKVSIIIPTTGNLKHLKPCLDSLCAKTKTPAFELILLDNGHGKYPEGIQYLNGTGALVISCPEPFNWSRLNNRGAQHATGEFLLFLNDDIEIIEENWLTELVAQASRLEVGPVGGLLLYPDGTIQHAGAFLVDHGGGVRHFLQGLRPGEAICQHLDRVAREVSACTGACLMIRREVFAELGGFDEGLAVAGNDIDLCLRAASRGYRTIFTPYCRLIHHESLSRKDIKVKPDEFQMWERWQDAFLAGDPYYNRNLAQDRTDFSLNLSILQAPISVRYRHCLRTGVNLIGYIRAEMGLGEAARGNAYALEMGGVPFTIIDYEHGHAARIDDRTWSHRLTKEPIFDINILHVNADLVTKVKKRLGREIFKARYTIGFWAWELPHFPNQWCSSFDEVNEIWVPSTFVMEAVKAKAPLPVHCFPHPIRKAQSGSYLGRTYFGLPANQFLFLSMYDFYSIQERKNPRGGIEAFKKTFAPGDNRVALIVKLNNAKDEDLDELRQVIGEHKNIVIIDRVLSRFEVDSLIYCCDCFVSLHRAEGFGLVLAEAMCLGRPVIATGWSGNMEFMTEENAACVRYELKKIGRDYGPYEENQYWADPDLDHAGWWMRKMSSDSGVAAKLGSQGQSDIQQHLSPLAIGQKMRKRIERIREEGLV